MQEILYLALGIAVGLIGTLIGAGGGFLLAPVFLFMYPEMSPARLTALSLLAVCANSISGSLGYAARKQVHWPSVVLYSLAAAPGVFFGVYLSRIFPRSTFELAFAGFLFCMSIYVFWRSMPRNSRKAKGELHWSLRAQWLGSGVSFFVGILSSLLGIGGGIVHVPLLSEFLGYPIHLAAGTSHAILATTSIIAVADHALHGDLKHPGGFVPFLVAGLISGAQVGAHFSRRVKSHWILRLLSGALLLVSVRLLWKAL